MLRSIICRSVTRIAKKNTIHTPSLTSLSRFSFPENASPRTLSRFFSESSNEEEIPISSTEKLTNSSDWISPGNDDFVEDETPVVDDELVLQFDDEKFESALALLRSDDDSLEFGLNALDLDLNLDFVMRVFETQGISGKNLIRFLKWSTATNEEITITTQLLESLVVVVSTDRSKLDVYALWDLVKEIGEDENTRLVLNLEILNDLIALFSNLGKPKAAFDVFNLTEEFGFTPNAKTYYLTLDALCQRKVSTEWACVVCDKMMKSGLLTEGKEIGNVITWFCNLGKPEEAYSVYELVKTKVSKEKLPPSKSVTRLITALSKNDATVPFAQEILNDLTSEARRRGIESFSNVIRSLCKMGNVKDAKGLLLDMIANGPPPGNSVFNLIIHAFSKTGDLNEAKSVLKLMESRGLKPDVYTYTVIISGYAKGALMEEAREVLVEAQKKHKKLSTVTYHALIRGYCKIGEYDEAMELLKEMENFGVEANADEYTKLIQSFCLEALDWEKAEMLVEEMKQKGLHLNANTHGLIRAVKEMVSQGKGSNLVAAV